MRLVKCLLIGVWLSKSAIIVGMTSVTSPVPAATTVPAAPADSIVSAAIAPALSTAPGVTPTAVVQSTPTTTLASPSTPAIGSTPPPTTTASVSAVPTSSTPAALPPPGGQSVLVQIADLIKRVEAVGGLTPQDEKDKILNQVREIIAGMATMVANDLEQTKILLDKIAANKQMLAQNQQAVFKQWQSSVKRASKLIDGQYNLLTSIKNACTPPDNAPADWVLALPEKKFTQTVHAIYFAINFLSTATLDAAEKDPKLTQSLAGRVSVLLPYIFNARGGKGRKSTTALYRALYVANKQGFDKVIQGQQVRMSRIVMLLTQAMADKVVLDGLKKTEQAVKLLETTGYEHEKRLLSSYFDTVFANRAKHAAIELTRFTTLLQSVVDKNLLLPADAALWSTRIPLVKACSALAQDYQSIDKAITAYKNILPTIVLPEAQAERSLFATVLAKLFGQRSALSADQSKLLTAFFAQVKLMTGILASNQVAVFDLWLDALRAGK